MNEVGLAFITETWLNENIDDSAVEIDGFTLVRRDRTTRVGGGVCAYIKDQIPFNILTDLHEDSFESLWLYLRPKKLFRGFSCLVICLVYHPPTSDNSALIDHLSSKLDAALTLYPNAGIFIIGDFNKCPISSLLRHFTLKQIVKEPTRGNAILDLILTNMSACCNSPLLLPPIGQSDHNAVLWSFNKHTAKYACSKVKIRSGRNYAKNAFGKWLADINWIDLYRAGSCEHKLNIFQTVISTGLDIFFPSKTVKLHDHDKPWVTPEFKKIIQDRQRAFRQGRSSQYRRLRNLANRESKRLKSTFLKKKLDELKVNPDAKKWWQCIKQLAGFPKSKILSSFVVNDQVLLGKELADKINDVFVSSSKDIPPLNETSVGVLIENSSTNILPQFIIDEKDVYNKLAAISVAKSPGPDGIPNWVLKSYAYVLSSPVASIFNASIQDGVVPSMWKNADVIPIPKKSVPSDISKDLRPISLTATLSKICERFVTDWLLWSIGTKIDTRQFGSIKNSSATHALLSLIHNLLSATDASSSAVRVFLLDFEKAFDRIDHNILVNKLRQMNVPQFIIKWIRSFLSDRKQRVKLTNCYSDWQTLKGGVPQGSVLGPVLFLVMINDLLIDWSDRWKYVDDSTFAERVSSTGNSELQELVNVIYDWTKVNHMKLNIGKCKELIIDFAKEKHDFLPLTINNVGIERTKSARILGLFVQDNLKWNEHVNHIVKKAGKRLYMLRVLKRSNADINTLITVYCVIIRPILEYACQVWHFNITEYLSEDIEKVQKRALRIVLPLATYSEACRVTGVPSLKDRRQLLCERFFVKNAHGNKLGELLPPKLEHNYNMRHGCDYNNYNCKTDRFLKSFFPQMISYINRP